MKRNKPLCKTRKAGTQIRLRRPYWYDERRAETWKVYVPQSLVGTDARTFSMAEAVPAGEGDNPGNPGISPSLYRWRLDVDGKSVLVYVSWGAWYPWSTGSSLSDVVAHQGDTWYVFTAEGKCDRLKCPFTRYGYSDKGDEIPQHRPGRCPGGIPLDATWKYAGRTTI
jgi:hypothetical protein